MSDMENILKEIRHAEREKRPIDNACARMIASLYHTGQGSKAYCFASTGFFSFPENTPIEMLKDAVDLWNEMFDEIVSSEDERIISDAFAWHLTWRIYKRYPGNIPGWSSLWID